MNVGQDLEIPIWQKKFDVRIFCFRLGRLKTLVLKNHFVCEVGFFSRAGHILVFDTGGDIGGIIGILICPLSWSVVPDSSQSRSAQ